MRAIAVGILIEYLIVPNPMQIYWSIKEIPELTPLSHYQQKQAWTACYRKYAFKCWPSWICPGLMTTLTMIGMEVFHPILGGALGAGLGGGFWMIAVMNALRPYLKRYVEQSGWA